MQELPIFKIHCSSIHSIVTGLGDRLTVKQQKELDKLKAKEVRTFNDQLKIDALEEKQNKPLELSVGAKTFCEEWLKSQIYNESYEFNSKYTDKGTDCEQAGIDMVAERMGYGYLTKNEQQLEDEYMIGTPDVLTKEFVEEIKAPYSSKTFPLFEDKLHVKANEWQVQGYMNLTGKPKAAVNYCLIDAPPHVIEREMNIRARAAGMIDIPAVFEDYMTEQMTYGNVPIELRHKRWEFDRDDKAIDTIKTAVILCREYIDGLLRKIYPDLSITLIDPHLKCIVKDKV